MGAAELRSRIEVANVGTQAAFVEAHLRWAAGLVHLPHIRAQTRHWLGLLGLDQDTEHKDPDGTRFPPRR